MFSNFFDGKQLKNFIQQKYSPIRTINKQLGVRQNKVEKQKKNSQSPITPNNKSNLILNEQNNSQKIDDRKCSTPDNLSHKQHQYMEKSLNFLQQMKNQKQEINNKIHNLKSNMNKEIKNNSKEKSPITKKEYNSQQVKFGGQINKQQVKKQPQETSPMFTKPNYDIQQNHQKQKLQQQQNISKAQSNLLKMKKQLQLLSKNSKQVVMNNKSKSPLNQQLQQIQNRKFSYKQQKNNKNDDIQLKTNNECQNQQQEKNDKNNRLIYYSKINDWDKCVQLLSKKSMIEVDVNCSDKSQWSPLHFSCFNSNLLLVTLLIAKDANVNAITNSGMTALMIATQKGSDEIVQYLLNQQIDINQMDNYKNTALHYSCLVNNKKCVEILLNQDNLDITIQNFEKKPAFELTKNQEILGLFNEYFSKKRALSQRNKVQNHKQNQNNFNTTMCSQNTQITKKQSMDKIKIQQNSMNTFNKIMESETNWDKLDSSDKNNVSTQDFHIHGLLGKGSFGEVYLVEKKDTQEIFAMKALDKSKIQKHNLIKYAMTERNVLSSMNHPFIVKLNFAFQTIDKLFLILEFAPGGDLGEHLQNEKKFNEEKTRIYICEIILALEDLHKKDIIFRDLKPENIVLDQDGHALLTDFGLSKEGVYDPNVGARSFCGSVAYLAPEMLKRQGHGKAVDWYLLGVVMYEMLVGIPPYYANSREQLFHNIENGVLKIPSNISDGAKSLLKALLQRNPLKRLGSGKGDAEEIKCHSFFQNVDWNQVQNRQLKPQKINHKIKINPKFNNGNVFSQQISKNDDEYVSGWSFVNRES